MNKIKLFLEIKFPVKINGAQHIAFSSSWLSFQELTWLNKIGHSCLLSHSIAKTHGLTLILKFLILLSF